jgi:hypothetical protein
VDKESKECEQIKSELELVKKQRDIALRKLNKALKITKNLRQLIESNQ